MNNQYLVIKGSGNWITREQLKQRLKLFFEDIDILDDDTVITCCRERRAPKEITFDREYVRSIIKREIALDIGDYLLKKGLIHFTGFEDELTFGFVGKITIISEAEKGGDDEITV